MMWCYKIQSWYHQWWWKSRGNNSVPSESVPWAFWLLREVIRRLGQLFYFQAHGNSYEWSKDQVLYHFLVHFPSICFLFNSESDWLFSSIFHRLQQVMRPTFVWFLQLEFLNRSHWYQNLPYHSFCLTLGTISCILWRICRYYKIIFSWWGVQYSCKNTKPSLPHNTTASKYTYMIALKNTSFCALVDFLTSLSGSMKTPIKYLDLRGPNEITTVVISLSFSHIITKSLKRRERASNIWKGWGGSLSRLGLKITNFNLTKGV